MAELVTIPNVHLLSVGTWECSTGVAVFTVDDLASCVAAQDDPGIRTPIVKLGHLDTKHGIEAPAVGRIENLRLSDDGVDLYGDLVGVPKWLAEILPSAFPDRSIEATLWKNYTGSTGHKHPAILTGLALLGVSVPAIESLEDIRDLFDGTTVVAAGDGGVDAVEYCLTRKVPMAEQLPLKVRAAMNVDTIRGEFYENLPAGSWAWIREIWAGNDAFIIVDNDEGDLYKIPYTEGADGDPVFGEPVKVAVQYVPSTDDESDDGPIMLGRFAPQDPKLSRGDSIDQPEGGHMLNKDLLVRLGLDEDASEEDIETALASKLDEHDLYAYAEANPTLDLQPQKPEAPELRDGVVALDAEQLEDLKVAAARGVAADERIRRDDRDRFLDDAVRLGKFPPARRDHYASLFDKDPDGTREFIEKLAVGAIPVTAETGHAGSGESLTDDAIWAGIAGMSTVISTEEGA